MIYKITSLAAMLMLAGCSSQSIIQDVKDTQEGVLARAAAMNASTVPTTPTTPIRGTAQHADKLAQDQAMMPVMRRSSETYIGSNMVPVTSDDKLPSVFRQEFTFHTDDRKVGRTVTMAAIANRIFNTTRIPVRIAPDVGALSVNTLASPPKGATGLPDAAETASSMTPVVPLLVDIADLKYSGPLVGFLNHLVDRHGLAWEYRDGTVVIMRFVTEAHEIASFIGKSKYGMSAGGGSSGSTAGSTSSASRLEVNDDGETDSFSSLEKAVGQMISTVPGSTLVRSDGTKKLIVKTSREMQAQVRDYLASENASMKKQALIQFDVYSVQTNDTDERGVNWNLVFNSLSSVYGTSISSPAPLTGQSAAQIGLAILRGNTDTTRRFANTAAFFNLLNQTGTSVQHRIIPMIALNGTWARKSRLSTESYISETTPGASSVTGAGTPGIKTDKITTGDQYQVLPQILDNNSVLLKFGISLSDLLGLTDVTSGIGANQQKVQTTKVSSNSEQYSVLIRPGEVMSITGLSRVISTGDQRSLSANAPPLLGGSRKVGVIREHFIIFVRPVIL